MEGLVLSRVNLMHKNMCLYTYNKLNGWFETLIGGIYINKHLFRYFKWCTLCDSVKKYDW